MGKSSQSEGNRDGMDNYEGHGTEIYIINKQNHAMNLSGNTHSDFSKPSNTNCF